jgi:cytochrome c-type biogenesis protein CcmH/NrfF
MHREVMDLVRAGKNSEEIIAAFVDKYGERVLMAPKPVGFNLAGYLVPGLVVLLAAVVLAVILLRRHRMADIAAAAPVSSGAPDPIGAASSEELERLKRALSEVAD